MTTMMTTMKTTLKSKRSVESVRRGQDRAIVTTAIVTNRARKKEATAKRDVIEAAHAASATTRIGLGRDVLGAAGTARKHRGMMILDVVRAYRHGSKRSKVW
jgi:hypothetical protein